MNYISYNAVEKLYAAYPVLTGILEILQADLSLIHDSETLDEDIYSIVMSRHDNGNIVQAGTSDITANTAIKYRRDSKLTEKELKKDILFISTIIEKIDIACNRLSNVQKTILELYYWEGRTWSEILKIIRSKTKRQYISKRQAQQERQDGIRLLSNVMKIAEEVFAQIMEYVEGREEE